MMVHVMVYQVKTLCYLPRGLLQRNGRATKKTDIRYSSATLLATYQTTQNMAMILECFHPHIEISRVALQWRSNLCIRPRLDLY